MAKPVTGQHSDRLLLSLNSVDTINPREDTAETNGTAAKYPRLSS